MKNILIDTDIGDDIDDALAIGFALNCPEVRVKAITTVYGDTETRAKLVLKLLKTFNREDIPLGVGIRKPLFSKEDIGPINQAAVLDEKEVLPVLSRHNAVDLIVSKVDSCRDLIIVPIGALTNIATALMKEPNLAKKAKLVMMGGVVNSQRAEYNVSCDPEAARIVFKSGIEIIMVGLDVTMRCQLRRVAVAVAFDQTLVKMEPRKVNVETRGEFTRGFTIASKSKISNVQVCLDVDAIRFIDLFMRTALMSGGIC
jgi:inosine-uridine nucleoside N-ribohydrolase